MIRRLQLKFVAIILAVLLLVFGAIFLSLNIFMQVSSNKQTEQLLEMVAAADGQLPRRDPDGPATPENPFGTAEEPPAPPTKPQELSPTPQRQYSPESAPQPGKPGGGEMSRISRYFWVKLDADGEVVEAQVEMMFDFTEQEAVAYALQAYGRAGTDGVLQEFQYLSAAKDYGTIVVFAERSIETQMLARLLRVSLWLALGSGLISLLLAVLLSRWAVRPVQEAFEKQRRFISDASHELKTPLTIIAANADVLQNEIAENQRVRQIQAQTRRMGLLVNDLLTLAKTDEERALLLQEFDLSQAVLNTTLEFESRAFEEDRQLEYEISDHIRYRGDEARLRQVAVILIDNALKHSPVGGRIVVRLVRENGKLLFSVYNSGAGVPETEQAKIFERFYRSDSSRSRDTGGYGLGLAIAKAIVEAHNGKISVSGQAGSWVQFTVQL